MPANTPFKVDLKKTGVDGILPEKFADGAFVLAIRPGAQLTSGNSLTIVYNKGPGNTGSTGDEADKCDSFVCFFEEFADWIGRFISYLIPF